MHTVKRNGGLFVDLSLCHLRVTNTTVQGVWLIALPGFPWQYGKAEEERNMIVTKLSETLPFRALWMSDWASEERPGWRIPGVRESISSIAGEDELSNGGWALLFFDHDPGELVMHGLSCVPDGPQLARRMLEDLSAGALISSWYDDKEWLLASTID